MSLTDPETLITRGFEEITGLGSIYVLILYLTILEVLGEKITNRILITATIINSTIIVALKRIIQAPRPETATEYLGYSFPSGHAATAFMAAAVLSHRYPKTRYIMLTIATLVAVGRVIIGAHFIQDIVVGAAIGYTIGTITTIQMEKMIQQNKILTKHKNNT